MFFIMRIIKIDFIILMKLFIGLPIFATRYQVLELRNTLVLARMRKIKNLEKMAADEKKTVGKLGSNVNIYN